MNALEKIMGVEEASQKWGLSPGYIKNLCAAGKVEAVKIGKTWIIAKEQSHPSSKEESLVDKYKRTRAGRFDHE